MTNWRTTLSGSLVAIIATLTTLAILPYDTDMQLIGEVFGQEVRETIIKVGIVSALILRLISAGQQADAKAVKPIVDLIDLKKP